MTNIYSTKAPGKCELLSLKTIIEQGLLDLGYGGETLADKRSAVLANRYVDHRFPICEAIHFVWGRDIEADFPQTADRVLNLPLKHISQELLAHDATVQDRADKLEIVAVPMANEIATIERISERHYRIAINEYVMLVLDPLIRHSVNATGDAHDDMRALFPEPWEYRIDFDAPDDNLDSTLDAIQAMISLLVDERIATLVELMRLAEWSDLLNSLIATSNAKRYADFDGALQDISPKETDTGSGCGVKIDLLDAYQTAYMAALGVFIGHEVSHLTLGHFEGTGSPQAAKRGFTSNGADIRLFLELDADHNANNVGYFITQTCGLRPDLLHETLGASAAHGLVPLIDNLIFRVNHSRDLDAVEEVLCVGSLLSGFTQHMEIFHNYPTPIERATILIANTANRLNLHEDGEADATLCAAIAGMFHHFSKVGDLRVSDRDYSFLVDPLHHPLFLPNSLEKRLQIFERLPAEERSKIRDQVACIIADPRPMAGMDMSSFADWPEAMAGMQRLDMALLEQLEKMEDR